MESNFFPPLCSPSKNFKYLSLSSTSVSSPLSRADLLHHQELQQQTLSHKTLTTHINAKISIPLLMCIASSTVCTHMLRHWVPFSLFHCVFYPFAFFLSLVWVDDQFLSLTVEHSFFHNGHQWDLLGFSPHAANHSLHAWKLSNSSSVASSSLSSHLPSKKPVQIS